MKKYLILVHSSYSFKSEEIGKKICEELGIEKLPEPDYSSFGYRDKDGNLDWSFLDLGTEKEGKITITDSDNMVRQINLAILKGSLEKKGLNIPSGCEEVKGIDWEEVGAYWISDEGEVEELEVDESGFSVPWMDEKIEEMNKMMEDMYYENKYGEKSGD